MTGTQPGVWTAAAHAVAEIAAEHAARADREARFPLEALAAARESGLLGLLVPADLGGLGGGLRDLVDVTTTLARTDLSVALVLAMHCQQVAVVDRAGTDELRRTLLPAVARGEVYLGSVTTEAGTGGHLMTSGSVTAAGADGAILIDRDAPVVTGGPHADGYLVTVLAPGATSPTQVTLVYAPRDALEVEVRGGWDPLGMRATHSVPLRLRGTVEPSAVVGGHEGFRTLVTTVFAPLAHVGWSAAWLGTASGALARVVAHLRTPAGRRELDVSSELVRARLADVRGRLEVVDALLGRVLDMLGSGADVSTPRRQMRLNTLKVRAADECFAAVDELIELVGLRHGYLVGSPLRLEQAFRDLRSASINYRSDRLRLANGSLALLDPEVDLA
ncbi:acyl-CoA dehydrogenase family protein [Cellulomonas wangsupingiae]|uniref:Acyl-CoA/acyl-ACP dehydrogenase n=1 Tax=Cellulomonas wangsupingiae TaxID=2968085 RepID=A0ABY5K9N1_9CELL|nr:acyl-CoA dehydrogenase family protein [Cellulomonas wangsupingiae]MCC2333047.1 acyl-CoA/acyl-ACP dehydrogenase [Cellulomonas wangsupingiae]MCM0640405.1 acyl-CoA/acyl-ACP dehydrogenase [Cellulomonas wangsupingiae]UUI66763.1 acyl-CoA/acyl-ACP dehydrogenase [Cellulomonas wangsupingiae]